jgi:hypothetical protein
VHRDLLERPLAQQILGGAGEEISRTVKGKCRGRRGEPQRREGNASTAAQRVAYRTIINLCTDS